MAKAQVVASACLSIVFSAAALGKLWDAAASVRANGRASASVPARGTLVAAALIELVFAPLMLARRTRRLVSLASLGLFGFYTIHTISASSQGRTKPCRCVGPFWRTDRLFVVSSVKEAREAHGMAVEPATVNLDRVRSLALPTLGGDVVRIEDFRAESVLLLSVHAECDQCSGLVEKASAWRVQGDRGVLIAGPAGLRETHESRSVRVVIDETFQAGRSCGAARAPSALISKPRDLLLGNLAEGHEAIGALLLTFEEAADGLLPSEPLTAAG